jgi:hypothetical protein
MRAPDSGRRMSDIQYGGCCCLGILLHDYRFHLPGCPHYGRRRETPRTRLKAGDSVVVVEWRNDRNPPVDVATSTTVARGGRTWITTVDGARFDATTRQAEGGRLQLRTLAEHNRIEREDDMVAALHRFEIMLPSRPSPTRTLALELLRPLIDLIDETEEQHG